MVDPWIYSENWPKAQNSITIVNDSFIITPIYRMYVLSNTYAN